MDRRSMILILVLAVLAVVAVAAIASSGSDKAPQEETPTPTPDPTPDPTPAPVPQTVPTISVELDRTAEAMKVGQTLKASATVSPSNSTEGLAWSTSDAAVATVSQDGTVKAVGPGTATITASSGGCSASMEVKVSKQATQGERNALESAKSYLRMMPFSAKELMDQLAYEGYTEAEARYGVENCGADWMEQAVKSAKASLEASPHSEKGLRDQLVYEGFTEAQAEHGAKECGADWQEQAERSARAYLDMTPMSKESLVAQLEYEGFTAEQARKAAEAVYA